jgi:hypothetical protein
MEAFLTRLALQGFAAANSLETTMQYLHPEASRVASPLQAFNRARSFGGHFKTRGTPKWGLNLG